VITRNARSGERSALTPSATFFSASMSRPESVSSRIASFGSSTASLEDLVALLLATRESFVDAALQQPVVEVQHRQFLAHPA
jgi:hypothetical protein